MGRIDVERPAVEERLMDHVAEQNLELGVLSQGGVRFGNTAGGACHVPVQVRVHVDDPLGIPGEELEAGAVDAALGGVPVVPGPVAVAGEEVDEHVVDVVLEVSFASRSLYVDAPPNMYRGPVPGKLVSAKSPPATPTVVFAIVFAPGPSRVAFNSTDSE